MPRRQGGREARLAAPASKLAVEVVLPGRCYSGTRL